jgi:small subunit ribosomal protein S2
VNNPPDLNHVGQNRAALSEEKGFTMATEVDIKQLLQAGAHFGHKTSRWHPKMAQYIHSKRDGTHIIDLTKTVEGLEEVLPFITKTVAAGKQVLLVGTKRQAKDIVKAVGLETNMPYVTERWLGGMLTNKQTIGGRIKHLKDLEVKMASGFFESKYNKLEVQRIQEEIDQMNFLYGGVKELSEKPGAVFVVDVLTEANALREAQKLGLTTIAIADTNVDPTGIDYVIPANDDAIKALELIVNYIKQAILEGKSQQKAPKAVDKTEGDK